MNFHSVVCSSGVPSSSTYNIQYIYIYIYIIINNKIKYLVIGILQWYIEECFDIYFLLYHLKTNYGRYNQR